MTYTIKERRDTAGNWATINPVLAEGELGFETNTLMFKMGDGSTPWLDLEYINVQGPPGVDGEPGPPGTPGAEGTVYVDRFTATAGQTAFVTSNPPTGELLVYRNGLLQRLTTDYTVSGSTITFTTGALVGDAVTITYGVVAGTAGPPGADGAEGASYIDYLTATAGQTAFVTSQTPTGVISVFRNGLLQRVTTDYTVSGSTVTLTTGALVGDAITLMYGVVGGTAGPPGPAGPAGAAGAAGPTGPTGPAGPGAWTKVIDNQLVSLTGFTAGAGAWTASGSGIRQATTGNSRKVLFLDAEVDQSDFIVEAEVKIDTSTSTVNGRVGFLFDAPAADTSGGTSVLLVTSGSLTSVSHVYFEEDQVLAGATRALPSAFATGVWKKLRVHKSGRHFAAYVDGVLVGQSSVPTSPDAPRDVRRIALYSYESDASYRNLKIWTQADPDSSSTTPSPSKSHIWTPEGSTNFAKEFRDASDLTGVIRVDNSTSNAAAQARSVWSRAGDSLCVENNGTVTTDAAGEMHGYVWPYALAVGESLEGGPIVLNGVQQAYAWAGIVITDGVTYGSGNQILWSLWHASDLEGNPQDGLWTGWNARVAFTDRSRALVYGAQPPHFKIKRTASNTWQFFLSADGLVWIDFGTRTLTMTPTHVGFATGMWGATGKHAFSFDYLRVIP